MYLKCQTCRTCITVWCICYRLIKNLTWREVQKRNMRKAEALDLSEEQLAAGERNICPLWWMKGALEVLHKEMEAYMTGVMEDANLLAIHAWCYTIQPRDIQLARCILGEANWETTDYTNWYCVFILSSFIFLNLFGLILFCSLRHHSYCIFLVLLYDTCGIHVHK